MKKVELYSASWCSSCEVVKPIVEKLENVEVEIIDVEKETDRAVSLGIRNIPVIRLLDENGEQVHRFVGKVSKEEILSYLE
jgi:thioredoxin-like negative regulator of GroEL